MRRVMKMKECCLICKFNDDYEADTKQVFCDRDEEYYEAFKGCCNFELMKELEDNNV